MAPVISERIEVRSCSRTLPERGMQIVWNVDMKSSSPVSGRKAR
jgi:hypothetical protein